MHETPPLSIIIPAFNEADRLPAYLTAILDFFRDHPIEVIVVDDGSQDATASVVADFQHSDKRIQIIRIAKNQGKGNAVKTGMLAAKGDLRLFTDADGSIPIDEYPKLKAAIDAGYDIAIGSKARDGSLEPPANNPWLRQVLRAIFNFLTQRLFINGIIDTQCGFKLFSARASEELFPHLNCKGYLFDLELLTMADKRGFKIKEVPVPWQHMAGGAFNPMRHAWRMAWDLAMLYLKRLRS
ncbi:MAG: dolichyl-phosphate beta-glucosyltransferase [Elusimicrobiota bacterium]